MAFRWHACSSPRDRRNRWRKSVRVKKNKLRTKTTSAQRRKNCPTPLTNANLLSPFHIREMAKFGDRDATRWVFFSPFVLFLVIANAPPTKNTFKYTIVAQRENDTQLSYVRLARTYTLVWRVREGRERVQIGPRERRLRNFRKLNRQWPPVPYI